VCVRLLTIRLEGLLEGPLAENYRWLMSRYPVVRRVWVVESTMKVEEDDPMIPVVRGWTSPDRSDPGLSPTSDWTRTAKNRVVVQFRPVQTGLIPV